MNQNAISNSVTAALNTINRVEGFDPASLAVEYVDLSTQEKRKRLPVMAQLGWFRMKYPEGKIAISVEPGKDCFVATAKIYVNYRDPVECYLAEATASRKYDPMKPTVSPREWAQTAAIGIALRNAGFGLQFGAAGDDFENEVPDELGAGIGFPVPPAAPPEPHSAKPRAPIETGASITPPEPAKAPEVMKLTPEQRFEQACAIISPIKKHGGKTLGEILRLEPGAINWLATKFSRDENIRAAAEYICSYSLEQATA